MKTVLVLTLVVFTALCVSTASPPACWCAPETCRSVANCTCGTHRDYCGCCDH